MKVITLFLLTGTFTFAASVPLTVDVDKPGGKVSPLLYGVFFEEINRAGDGGLYAEMIQNRSFEDADKPVAWTSLEGSAELDKTKSLNANNPTSLRFEGRVANEGFHGVAVQQDKRYRLSLYARGEGSL